MTKTLNLTELATLVEGMTAALAHFNELVPPHKMALGDWHRQLYAANENLRDEIDKLGGWLSRPAGDGIAVTLGGLRASSTSGMAGACRNWLGAAKRRLEAVA